MVKTTERVKVIFIMETKSWRQMCWGGLNLNKSSRCHAMLLFFLCKGALNSSRGAINQYQETASTHINRSTPAFVAVRAAVLWIHLQYGVPHAFLSGSAEVKASRSVFYGAVLVEDCLCHSPSSEVQKGWVVLYTLYLFGKNGSEWRHHCQFWDGESNECASLMCRVNRWPCPGLGLDWTLNSLTLETGLFCFWWFISRDRMRGWGDRDTATDV